MRGFSGENLWARWTVFPFQCIIWMKWDEIRNHSLAFVKVPRSRDLEKLQFYVPPSFLFYIVHHIILVVIFILCCLAVPVPPPLGQNVSTWGQVSLCWIPRACSIKRYTVRCLLSSWIRNPKFSPKPGTPQTTGVYPVIPRPLPLGQPGPVGFQLVLNLNTISL